MKLVCLPEPAAADRQDGENQRPAAVIEACGLFAAA
jgi:hypothetical protein